VIEFNQLFSATDCWKIDEFEKFAMPGCDIDGGRVFSIPDLLPGFVPFKHFCGYRLMGTIGTPE
jgi:hypothetical protein